jgi:hypothetical protein
VKEPPAAGVSPAQATSSLPVRGKASEFVAKAKDVVFSPELDDVATRWAAGLRNLLDSQDRRNETERHVETAAIDRVVAQMAPL